MDWYPLWNSLRIAAISSVVVFFTGIAAAYYAARLPRVVKGVLDVVLTLPMVLPPTVCGYFLLLVFGVKRPLGMLLDQLGLRFVMTWYGGILAAVVVAFPLMYRTARGAFESFDPDLAASGQTLGLSNTFIFWRVRMPACKQGILAGAVLAFARALGEYGATSMLIGYTPGKSGHHLHHGVPAVAHQRRAGRHAVGPGEPGHQRRGAAGGEPAGGPAEQEGGEAMSLQIDIHKQLGDFSLDVALEASPTARNCWACWGPPAAGRASP